MNAAGRNAKNSISAKRRASGFVGSPAMNLVPARVQKNGEQVTLSSEDGCIAIAGEVDRIYQDSEDTVFVRDPALGRQIRVDKSGSRSTIVWNPWIEKSERLGDMGPDGYRQMVCIETANAGGDVVTLAPGQSHTLAARISAQRL